MPTARVTKYNEADLIRMFRLAAKFRRQCRKAGFSDNMGAIHSAERILHLLGPKLVHPGMGHLNNLRKYEGAIFSKKARTAHLAGGKVQIEHVAPHRALTCLAIEKIEGGVSDNEFAEFIKTTFQIVLLTPEETSHLNRMNRTKIDPDRLKKAGIVLYQSKKKAVRTGIRAA
ncbi:MAG: hypothetical protein JSR72_13180 [Proteobacteria bacterium]|nr:hypothetical protein [Pseudomonadota bacterium]